MIDWKLCAWMGGMALAAIAIILVMTKLWA